jgi:hypothetical protein
MWTCYRSLNVIICGDFNRRRANNVEQNPSLKSKKHSICLKKRH